MDNNRKFYIEKIALDARNRLIEKGIIVKSQKVFNIKQLSKIVQFFSGELKICEDEQDTYLEKKTDDTYEIYYYPAHNYFEVIHELGHAFLNFDAMEIGERSHFHGNGVEDIEASLFARAFIMPRNDFEQVVIDNINNGKYSIRNVAEEYQIDYLEVLARGQELNFGC